MEPRRHRRAFNDAGHTHELTFSCYHQFPFLKADRTCQWFSDALQSAREQLDFDLWAYVLMPEHVHLIIRPRQRVYEIAEILQAIKEPVARQAIDWIERHSPDWIPRLSVVKNGRVRRHFWQTGGGYDRNIVEPATLLKMIDCIHENPVRRGLVEQAIHWKWSSAAGMLGLGESPIALDLIPPEWLSID